MLENRGITSKEVVYKVIAQLAKHKIEKVRRVDIGRIVGFSREAVERNVTKLIHEGRVTVSQPSHWAIS